jgi:hypothetical protein
LLYRLSNPPSSAAVPHYDPERFPSCTLAAFVVEEFEGDGCLLLTRAVIYTYSLS